MTHIALILLFTSGISAAPGPGVEQLFQAIAAKDAAAVKAMLAKDRHLAEAKNEKGNSAALTAMFLREDEAFVRPQSNAILAAILAAHPARDAFEEAAFGDPKSFGDHLKADPEIAKRVHKIGWTPLHFAAYAGNLETARLLLDQGADLEARAKNKFESTPLQAAALCAQADMIEFLIQRGANVKVKQVEGTTALHEAAILGNERMIRLLLDAGADVNAKMEDGRTPLDLALKVKQTKAAELLRARGAKDHS
jgi:ankyrin repeat protein